MTGTERVLTLSELQKRALRALGDARLVSLARDEKLSPREVLKRASGLSGLSRRQPEAARCMAVIRRDYGLEAMDQFISSMARARAEEFATEHAHRGEIMNDRLLESILALADLRRKFELLLKNNFGKEAVDLLLDLAENGTTFCWLNVSGGHVVSNPLGTEFRDSNSKSPIASVVLVFRRELEGFIPLGNQELSIWLVSLVPMLEKAGLENACEMAQQIVETVLRNTVKHDPRGEESPAELWNVLATTAVAREIWPVNQRNLVNNPLAFQVEIWQARFHFFGGDLGTLPRQVLPSLNDYCPNLEPTRNLDWLVDYFQQCGWTIEQVRQEFIDWLERHAEHNLNNEVFVAVAGSPCLHCGLALPKARSALHKRLAFCWQHLCREDQQDVSLKTFHTLGCLGLFSEEDVEYFRKELTNLMADGRVPFVMTVVRDLGIAMGLRTYDLGRSSSTKKAVMNVLNSLAPTAFDLAMHKQAFGVATALGQHFNCVDETQLRLKANKICHAALMDIYNWNAVLSSEVDRETVLLHILDGVCEQNSYKLGSESVPVTWTLTSPVLNYNFGLSAEQAERFFFLRDKRDEVFKDLIRLRRLEIKDTAQKALDLEMPIALDVVTLL